MTGIGEKTLAQPVKPPLRERRACLAKLVKNRLTLTDVSALSGWAAAVEGALRSLEATGGVDAATLELAAARAAAGDALVEYDEPVDLSGYDRAFGLLEGGAAGA